VERVYTDDKKDSHLNQPKDTLLLKKLITHWIFGVNQTILIVNFGGPRSLGELEPFLSELLTDQELIRTNLPSFLHNYLFKRIAKKRSRAILPDYESIGGKSPIYDITEELANTLKQRTGRPVITFHRYLPSTHLRSLQAIEEHAHITVLPLFPQFSFATTGSIAALLASKLSCCRLRNIHWIKSYPAHPAFVYAWQEHIRSFLAMNQLLEQETLLFFSAHGIPRSFVCTGDPYEFECQQSYAAILAAFPKALGHLAYQSKFGPGEWLRPYTQDSCNSILNWNKGRKHVVFLPLAFTSDHIETLFEIEQLYLPLIREKGLNAWRCPAFNLNPLWINALEQLLKEPNLCPTQMLVRKKFSPPTRGKKCASSDFSLAKN
jgi:ferrochelatase